MTKQLCRDCKHLETDGMFGIFCGVGGDNTKYDCPKYAKRSDRMTEKRFDFEWDMNITDNLLDKEYDLHNGDEALEFIDQINKMADENQMLKEQYADDCNEANSKRFYFDWKTGRFKDTQSNQCATKNMRVLEHQINRACLGYEKQIDKLKKENKELNEENEQLKQFKEDVFTKIDMHLHMLPIVSNAELNEGYGDSSLYTGAIYMLETLKKELSE